ncbi:hypothetical protein GE09DRAFT_1151872 [Coniochaeta sp. 2T2.1]|nr:hypothetical protein GE09DRAFT_1151872 [Coniochaeta sp. 2T2.1]
MLLQGRRAGGHDASLAKPDLAGRDVYPQTEDHNSIEARQPATHHVPTRQDTPRSVDNRAITLTPRKPGEDGLATEAGIGVGVSIALVILLFVCSGCFTWRYRKRRRLRRAEEAKRARANSDTPKSEIAQTQSELEGGQTRTELHAGHGAGNTAEMDGDGPLAEMNGQGVTAELDHDEKAAMRQMESASASLSSSTGGRDTKQHRVSVYEMETRPPPPATTTTTIAVQLQQRPLSAQELAAYPFQRDEALAYGPQHLDQQYTAESVSPQSPLPRYQSVRSYGRETTVISPISSSPESVTQQQLQYYIGGREARRGGGGGQLGHVPSSEQELTDSPTTTTTTTAAAAAAAAGLSTMSSASEKPEPVWQAEPSAAELNMLMEEHRLLEERKMLQLQEIERRQAELRERIAAAKGAKDPGSPKGGSGGSDG